MSETEMRPDLHFNLNEISDRISFRKKEEWIILNKNNIIKKKCCSFILDSFIITLTIPCS